MRALALLAVLAAAGCAGELEDPARFTTCAPGYVEQMFQSRCGSCHGSVDPEAGLDLVSTGVEARLIGEASATPFCQGKMLIEPAATEPMQHLLLDKLQETPSCGSRMPFGTEALSADEIECVRRWVDEAMGEDS